MKHRTSSACRNSLWLLSVASLLAGQGEAASRESRTGLRPNDIAGRWILGAATCAATPDAGACAEHQIVAIEVDGQKGIATLERPSTGLQRTGVRKGRVMFSLTIESSGALAGEMNAVFPPDRRCSPEPFISASHPIVGGAHASGAVPRLTIEVDYRPYDHATCALHTAPPKRQKNIYHKLAAR
jgi:hypothetical protein